MAYFLFKYVRGKIRESNARKAALASTDDSNLNPEIHPGQRQKSEGHETLTSNPSNTHHETPYVADRFNAVSHEEQQRAKAQERAMTIHRWKMIAGLILPNFLASVDVTIVAPAIPTISSHFSTSFTLRYWARANRIFRPLEW